MALSVLSERAFSSTGITITKHCNQLKGDVVKALQCLKVLYHNNLIFQEVIGAAQLKQELKEVDIGTGDDEDWEDVDEEFCWDQLIVDDNGSDDNDIVAIN